MVAPTASVMSVEQPAADIEKGEVVEATSPTCSEATILVTWDEPSDPANPMNWSRKRKWFTTILTSLGGLVTLMSGAMLAPALDVLSKDLSISSAEASLALSIFILAFAFGPMILAPCSEVFGRRPIWIAGGSCYVIFNTVCGFSKNRGLLIFGRLMSGIGASAEFAVSGPIVNDCWSADERGKSMAVRGFLPLLGPALGPIIGGVMVQEVSWRWLFFVLSILDAMIVLLFIMALPETHAQTLLRRKASNLRKQTGGSYQTEYDRTGATLAQRLKLGLARPYRLLLTQPVIQLMSIFLAYGFGTLYIVLSTFSSLWTKKYGQSPSMSGLHYIALVIGYTIASQGGGWLMDRVWEQLKKKNEGRTVPENRVPLMVPGAFMLPIGLLWYGWAAQSRLHWIVVDLGAAVFGCGYMVSVTAAQAYVVEAFTDYTASAGAASQLLRNMFAFAFPVFAPQLYSTLGWGIENTVLAAVSLVLGSIIPLIMWKFGARLRGRGHVLK